MYCWISASCTLCNGVLFSGPSYILAVVCLLAKYRGCRSMFGPVVLVLCQFIFYLFVICLYKNSSFTLYFCFVVSDCSSSLPCPFALSNHPSQDWPISALVLLFLVSDWPAIYVKISRKIGQTSGLVKSPFPDQSWYLPDMLGRSRRCQLLDQMAEICAFISNNKKGSPKFWKVEIVPTHFKNVVPIKK